ncbi:hypothetical protein ACFWVF_13485 [Streptomyces sp. NPDC058659]|uniref:hypothetical protein n=1 Tax=unclassified Streptomyces TaxID=2593676 RepID=UPI0036583E26
MERRYSIEYPVFMQREHLRALRRFLADRNQYGPFVQAGDRAARKVHSGVVWGVEEVHLSIVSINLIQGEPVAGTFWSFPLYEKLLADSRDATDAADDADAAIGVFVLGRVDL